MTAWTADRVETALDMRRKGCSYKQIAKAVRSSRSAIAGLLYRHDLRFADPSEPKRLPKVRAPKRPKPSKPPKASKPRGAPFKPASFIIGGKGAVRARAESAPPRVIIPGRAWEPLSGSTPRPWIDRPNGACKWPVEIPGAEIQHSCCQPRADGHPNYCPAHAAINRDPNQKKTKKASRDLAKLAKRFAA